VTIRFGSLLGDRIGDLQLRDGIVDTRNRELARDVKPPSTTRPPRADPSSPQPLPHDLPTDAVLGLTWNLATPQAGTG
jgi:hypothetical protein